MQHNLLLHEQVTKSNQCSTSGGVSCFSITLNSLTPALHYLPISSAKAINSWRSYCFSAFSSRQNSYVLTLYHFKVRPFLTMRERKQIPYEKSSDLWVNIDGFSGRYSFTLEPDSHSSCKLLITRKEAGYSDSSRFCFVLFTWMVTRKSRTW
jgi:hypothetical protein